MKEDEPVGHMCNDAVALTMELPGRQGEGREAGSG